MELTVWLRTYGSMGVIQTPGAVDIRDQHLRGTRAARVLTSAEMRSVRMTLKYLSGNGNTRRRARALRDLRVVLITRMVEEGGLPPKEAEDELCARRFAWIAGSSVGSVSELLSIAALDADFERGAADVERSGLRVDREALEQLPWKRVLRPLGQARNVRIRPALISAVCQAVSEGASAKDIEARIVAARNIAMGADCTDSTDNAPQGQPKHDRVSDRHRPSEKVHRRTSALRTLTISAAVALWASWRVLRR